MLGDERLGLLCCERVLEERVGESWGMRRERVCFVGKIGCVSGRLWCEGKGRCRIGRGCLGERCWALSVCWGGFGWRGWVCKGGFEGRVMCERGMLERGGRER